MKTDLLNNLNTICLEFTNKLESLSPNYPIGTGYLIGHCLAEGFKKAGFYSREVTGTAIFKDKNEKNIIYGKSIVKGTNIGYYQTWCVLEIEGESIIIDPSIKYNKVAMKNYFNLKINSRIPDFIITNNKSSWLHTYVEDSEFTPISKGFLKTVHPDVKKILIDTVEELAVLFLGETNQSA
jgi:hypothetical protein